MIILLANNIPISHHQPNSDSSTDNSDDKPNIWVHPSISRLVEKRSSRYKYKQMVAPQPPVIPSGALSNKDCHNVTEGETMFSTRCKCFIFLIYFVIIKL